MKLLSCLAAVLSIGVLAAPLSAQTLKDPALEALHVAEQWPALQRLATQRLAAQPDDAQAVLALALAAMGGSDDAAARTRALDQARGCADRQPRAAPCQYALGVLLGVQAMTEGMISMARSAGTVKAALTAAHEIDPAWYPARSALLEFHVLAPGLMGGSASRAAELARGAPRPEQVSALQARLAMHDKRFDAALQALAALPPGLEPALAADVRGWGMQAAMGAVNAGQAAKAQPWLERLMRESPGHAAGPYGLARVRGELGDWAESLRLYEAAAALKDAADWPIAYRQGIALQQLGRPDEARAALARFIAGGKGQKASLEDARKRLSQLGG